MGCMQDLASFGAQGLLGCAEGRLIDVSACGLLRHTGWLWLRAIEGRLPLTLDGCQLLLQFLYCSACAGHVPLLRSADKRLLLRLDSAQLLLQVLRSVQRFSYLLFQGAQRLWASYIQSCSR